MNDAAFILQTFERQFRKEFPEYATLVDSAKSDGLGNFKVLDVPWRLNPDRCRVYVLYRGDCFEVAFSVAEARGPAEKQILIGDDVPDAVAATIDFLKGIFSSRILVDISRHRFLWFQPYHLAFFRETSRVPRGRVVETLCWAAKTSA